MSERRPTYDLDHEPPASPWNDRILPRAWYGKMVKVWLKDGDSGADGILREGNDQGILLDFGAADYFFPWGAISSISRAHEEAPR